MSKLCSRSVSVSVSVSMFRSVLWSWFGKGPGYGYSCFKEKELISFDSKALPRNISVVTKQNQSLSGGADPEPQNSLKPPTSRPCLLLHQTHSVGPGPEPLNSWRPPLWPGLLLFPTHKGGWRTVYIPTLVQRWYPDHQHVPLCYVLCCLYFSLPVHVMCIAAPWHQCYVIWHNSRILARNI